MESEKYFKIVSEFGNVIHIRPQGLWTDDVAEKFGEELKENFTSVVNEMHTKKKRFIVLANMSNFHIQGLKTGELLTELMKISVGNALFFRTVQIVPDPKTRREINASSVKAGQASVKFVVASVEEANAKILELKKELLRLI